MELHFIEQPVQAELLGEGESCSASQHGSKEEEGYANQIPWERAREPETPHIKRRKS